MRICNDRFRQTIGHTAFQWLVPMLGVKATRPFTDGPAIIPAWFDEIHLFHHSLPDIGDEESDLSFLRNIKRKTVWIPKSIGIHFGNASSIQKRIVRGNFVVSHRKFYSI